MATHTWQTVFQHGSEASATTTETVTASGESNISETIGVDAANVQISLAIDISVLKSIYLLCTKACTIYTNAASGGAYDHSIALSAGVPRKWVSTGPDASPFAGDATDVTSIFVTAAGASGTLTIYALQDATP